MSDKFPCCHYCSVINSYEPAQLLGPVFLQVTSQPLQTIDVTTTAPGAAVGILRRLNNSMVLTLPRLVARVAFSTGQRVTFTVVKRTNVCANTLGVLLLWESLTLTLARSKSLESRSLALWSRLSSHSLARSLLAEVSLESLSVK